MNDEEFIITQYYKFRPNVPKEKQNQFINDLQILLSKHMHNLEWFKVKRDD